MRDIIGPEGVIAPGKGASAAGEKPYFVVRKAGKQERKVEYEAQSFVGMIHGEIEHFAECVLRDKQPSVTGYDGKRAIEIALAIIESSRTGERVEL